MKHVNLLWEVISCGETKTQPLSINSLLLIFMFLENVFVIMQVIQDILALIFEGNRV